MSTEGAAVRLAATHLERFRDDTYPTDVFIPPTSDQFAEIVLLLERERGHKLDGVAAECYRRALSLAAKELRRLADDIDEGDDE